MNQLKYKTKIYAILIGSVCALTTQANTINSMYSISGSGISSIDVSNPYGKMAALPFAPIASSIGSSAIVSSPYNLAESMQRVYVANASTKSISIFKPNMDGSLTALSGVVATGNKPNFLAMDSNGKHLYSTNEDDNTVSVYNVDRTTGGLSVVATIATGAKPSSIVLNDTHAVVTNREGNTISMYTVDANTGVLANRSDTTVGEHPILARIIKNKFVHVLNEGTNGASTISQFSLPETGSSLIKLQPAQVGVTSNAQYMVTRDDEKFVFVASARSDHKDSIQVLSITEAGTLTPIQTMIGNTALTGTNSNVRRSLSMDPRNEVLYASNAELGTISTYKIDSATGKLNVTPITTLAILEPGGVVPEPVTNESGVLPLQITSDSNGLEEVTTKTSHDVVFTISNSNNNNFESADIYIFARSLDGCYTEDKSGTDIYTANDVHYQITNNSCTNSIHYLSEDSTPTSCSVTVKISVDVDITAGEDMPTQHFKLNVDGNWANSQYSTENYASEWISVDYQCNLDKTGGECGENT